MKDRLCSSAILLNMIVFLSFSSASCLAESQERRKVASKIEQEKKLEPDTATGTWEPIFFREIDQRAKIGGLRNLRATALSDGDLEVRVWIGFGLIPLEGFVIGRIGKHWRATHLRSISPHLPKSAYQNVLPSPRSGWNVFWRRLTDEGVLTLPDSSELKDEVITRDGESFVVQIKLHDSYRAYHYQNPKSQKWPEAARMVRIAQVILEEFRINRG